MASNPTATIALDCSGARDRLGRDDLGLQLLLGPTPLPPRARERRTAERPPRENPETNAVSPPSSRTAAAAAAMGQPRHRVSGRLRNREVFAAESTVLNDWVSIIAIVRNIVVVLHCELVTGGLDGMQRYVAASPDAEGFSSVVE